jgi:hypothetical protein
MERSVGLSVGVRVALVALGCLLGACAHSAQGPARQASPHPAPRPPAESPAVEGAVRELLRAFCDGAERGDFEAVHALLSTPLRERYTVKHLAEDFAREPLAAERIERLRAALTPGPAVRGLTVRGAAASLPIDAERAVELVKEGLAWRVATLE